MVISHRIRLSPNIAQREYFTRACGVARFAYNWALAEWHRGLAYGEKPTETGLRRRLNGVKRERFPWMQSVTKNAPQQAIKNLGRAYANYYAGRARQPRFKKKGRDDRFRADPGPEKARPNAVVVEGKRVKLPIVGWIRMREELRFAGRILSVVVSRRADHWYASFSVEAPYEPDLRSDEGIVGVDLGVTHFATLSDGTKIAAPKPLYRLLGRLRRLSQSLTRKQFGSCNRAKAKIKLARLHARVADIRIDALHKLSTHLTSYRTIVVEELNVSAMRKNRHLAKSISDLGFYSFRRQVEYKSAMANSRLVVASRWFASSKICSACRNTNGRLSLRDRAWACESCGTFHDRDVNAALNLARYAESLPALACGAERCVAADGSAALRAEAGSSLEN